MKDSSAMSLVRRGNFPHLFSAPLRRLPPVVHHITLAKDSDLLGLSKDEKTSLEEA